MKRTLVVLMALAVISGCSSSATGQADTQRYGAFDVCTRFVKDRLKAPATASFRDYFEDDGEVTVTEGSAGTFTVRSSVDSENGFGAKLRTNFVCTVADKGKGNWRLVDVQLDE